MTEGAEKNEQPEEVTNVPKEVQEFIDIYLKPSLDDYYLGLPVTYKGKSDIGNHEFQTSITAANCFNNLDDVIQAVQQNLDEAVTLFNGQISLGTELIHKQTFSDGSEHTVYEITATITISSDQIPTFQPTKRPQILSHLFNKLLKKTQS